MKRHFPSFYELSDAELDELWRTALFSFDANVLLGLYRYVPKTQRLLLNLISGLRKRVWLTHQAAFEYQKNRVRVIREQLRGYEEARKALDAAVGALDKSLTKLEQRHRYIRPREIVDRVRAATNRQKTLLDSLKRKHPDLVARDNIRSRLDRIFEGRIGPPFDAGELESVFQEAARRIERRIPPGYADERKEGPARFGDVFLWLQLIRKAEREERPLVLVTDERKDDWWEKDRGHVVGPRAELRQEMHSRAGVTFHMYDTSAFIPQAQKHLDLLTEEEAREAVEEVQDVRESDAPQPVDAEPFHTYTTTIWDAHGRPLVLKIPAPRMPEDLLRSFQFNVPKLGPEISEEWRKALQPIPPEMWRIFPEAYEEGPDAQGEEESDGIEGEAPPT